jgi:hypothetical protein
VKSRQFANFGVDLETANQAALDQSSRSAEVQFGPLPSVVAGLVDSALDSHEHRVFRDATSEWAVSSECFSVCFAILRTAVSPRAVFAIDEPAPDGNAVLSACLDSTMVEQELISRLSRSFEVTTESEQSFDSCCRGSWNHLGASFNVTLRAALVYLRFCATSLTAIPLFLQEWFVPEHDRAVSLVTLMCMLREAVSSGSPTNHLMGEGPLVGNIVSTLESLNANYRDAIQRESRPASAPAPFGGAKRSTDSMSSSDAESDSSTSKRQRVKVSGFFVVPLI